MMPNSIDSGDYTEVVVDLKPYQTTKRQNS